MRAKALATVTLLLTLALWVSPSGAAAPHVPTIRREVLSVRLADGGLVVVNTVTFSARVASPVRIPLLPGARGVHGAGFSPAGMDSVAIRSGADSVTLRYGTALPSQGLSVAWWLPGPTQEFVVETGPGVSFPIELNQAFYPQGTGGSGDAAIVSIARHLSGGPMRLNFEFTPPAPPVFYYGYAEMLTAVVIGVFLVWWWRRPAADAEAPLPHDGVANGKEN
ncbi:MAG: hypothetical protein K6V73_05710 [Firmicutes bacterium]|nr:hypothetical protein [Bacillota bacterium]